MLACLLVSKNLCHHIVGLKIKHYANMHRVPAKNAYLFKSPNGRLADTISYLEYDGAFVLLIHWKVFVQELF